MQVIITPDKGLQVDRLGLRAGSPLPLAGVPVPHHLRNAVAPSKTASW